MPVAGMVSVAMLAIEDGLLCTAGGDEEGLALGLELGV
jgi:hypothetical protein